MSLEDQISQEVHSAIDEVTRPTNEVVEHTPNEVEKIVPATNTDLDKPKVATINGIRKEFTIGEIEEILKENAFQDETSEAFIRDVPKLATKIFNLIAENNNRGIIPDINKIVSATIGTWKKEIDTKMAYEGYDGIMKGFGLHGVDFNTFRRGSRETTLSTETALNLFRVIENNGFEIGTYVSMPGEIHEGKRYEIVGYTSRIYLKLKTPDGTFIVSPLKVTKVEKVRKRKKR